MARRKKRGGQASSRTGDGGVSGGEPPDDQGADAEEPPRLKPAPKITSRPFADALAGVTPDRKRRAPVPGAPHRRDPRRKDEAAPRPSVGSRAPTQGAGGRAHTSQGPPTLPGTRSPAPPVAPPGAATPAAATPRVYEERVALAQAYAGARPLRNADRPKRLTTSAPAPVDEVASDHASTPSSRRAAAAAVAAEESAARDRLDALVAGGVRFKVERDEDGNVSALRAGMHASHVRTLDGERPAATLDLHGMTGDEAVRATVRFVREHARRGDRVVRIVHGRGSHSDDRVGVLADRVVHALSQGAGAAFVTAFATAPSRHGGLGALLVRLATRR